MIQVLLFVTLLANSIAATCQKSSLYPPYTRWYQDPLGFRPLELSTAAGAIWGASAIAASLLLAKKDSALVNRLTVFGEGGYGFGYKPPYTGSLQEEAGVLYRARKWLSVGVGLSALYFKDRINHTPAWGLRPFARWYLFRRNEVSLFFEYGAGVCYSLKRFPLTGTGWGADTARTGTRFNLHSKYGIGVVIRVSSGVSFRVSARHFHLSNGNIKGIERNPAYDNNGFFMGLDVRY